MRNALILALLLLTSSVYAQFTQHPFLGKYPNNIYFYDDQFGFIGGDGFYKTTDGGQHWREIKPSKTDSIFFKTFFNRQIIFTTPQNGIAIGAGIFQGGGVVMTTNDGGESWKTVFKDVPLTDLDVFFKGFEDVHFYDQLKGFVIGDESRRIVTSDGGQTWSRSDLPGERDLNDIFFVTPEIGFIAGAGVVFKTINGGTTWTAIDLTDPSIEFTSIYFTTPSIGFAVSFDHVYSTVDGGLTWQRYFFEHSGIGEITFVDVQTGYVTPAFGDERNTFLRTVDGGKNWEEIDPGFSSPILDVDFRNATEAVACGSNAYYTETSSLGDLPGIVQAGFEVSGPEGYCKAPYKFSNKGNDTYAHKWYIDNELIADTYDFEPMLAPGAHVIKLATRNQQGEEAVATQELYVPDVEHYYNLQIRYPKVACENISFFHVTINNLWQYPNTKFELWANGKKLDVELTGDSFYFYNSLPLTSELIVRPLTPNVCYLPEHDVKLPVKVFPADLVPEIEVHDSVVCEGGKFHIVVHNTDPDLYYSYWEVGSGTGEDIGSQGNGGDVILDGRFHDRVEDGNYEVRAYTLLCVFYSRSFPIRASHVDADFELAERYIYEGESLQIANNSVEAKVHDWSFDSGSSQPHDNTEQPPAVTYNTTGTKKVVLNVDDGFGCKSEEIKWVFVADKLSTFEPSICQTVSSTASKKTWVVDAATDDEGSVYRGGNFNAPSRESGATDAFLSKHTKSGNLVWQINSMFPSYPFLDDFKGVRTRAIAVDAARNVYVGLDFQLPYLEIEGQKIGAFVDGEPDYHYDRGVQAAILKFSPEGQLVKYSLIYDTDRDRWGMALINDMVIDHSGQLFVDVNLGYDVTPMMIRHGNGVKEKLIENPVEFTPNNYIMKFDSDCRMTEKFGHGFALPSYFPDYTVYGAHEWHFDYVGTYTSRLAVDEANQVILSGFYNVNDSYSFGDIVIPEVPPLRVTGAGDDYYENAPNWHLLVGILGKDGWVNAFNVGHASVFHPNISVSEVIPDYQTGTIHISGLRYEETWIANEAIGKPMMVIGSDTVFYADRFDYKGGVLFGGQTAGSFLLKMKYTGDVEWVNFNDNASVKTMAINPASGNVVALGVITDFGVFGISKEHPMGLRSDSLNLYLAEYASTGEIMHASLLSADASERNGRFLNTTCGQLSFVSNTMDNYFIKTISLTNSCTSNPPILSSGSETPFDEYRICKGESTQLSIQGATSYKWIPAEGLDDPTSSSPVASPTTTTAYTVFGYSGENCFAKREVRVVVEGNPLAIAAITDNLKVSLSVPAERNTVYEWDLGNGVKRTGNELEYIYPQPGTYSICLKTTGGCAPQEKCITVEMICQPPKIKSYSSNQRMDYEQVFFARADQESVTWKWSFGDGIFSNEQFPHYVYTAPGDYNVKVSAKNNCASDSVTFPVKVFCLEAVPLYDGHFNDYTLTLTDRSYNAKEYLWDFGDGTTSTEKNPVHVYAAAGIYDFCLTVSNGCSTASSCGQIQVACNFDHSNFTPVVKDRLTIQVTSDYNIDGAWDFGDDQPGGTGKTQTHTYWAAGTYRVCHRVETACGPQEHCEYVSVNCENAIADFDYVVEGAKVIFNNTSDNFTSSNWNFGDNGWSGEDEPTHVFEATGTYDICLTVDNGCQEKETICKPILILVTDIEPEAETGFHVYPLPVEDRFSIRFDHPQNVVAIELISLTGVSLNRLAQENFPEEVNISMAGRSSGLYYLKVQYRKGSEGRFISKK